MSSPESSGVRREAVIAVLREAGVDCYPHRENPSMTVLAKDGFVQAYSLPAVIGRSMLGRFSAKFGVPAHKFWNATATVPDELAERRKTAEPEKKDKKKGSA